MPFSLLKIAALSGTALALFSAGSASAAETVAGTSIANTASVTFSVGGSTSTVQSNTATFVVDKKVNLAVAEVGNAPTSVALGANDQVTTFTVTNLTNAIQDIRLVAEQQNISIPLLGTDNFDVNNMRVFVDSNGNGVYDAADVATFIDELAPDATRTVFIVSNIPNTPGASAAIVSLNAVVAGGGGSGALGADLVATPLLTADSPTTVDIVFADGTSAFDLPRNGQQRAFDIYLVDTASVALSKSAVVLADPVNLAVFPRAIPGAIVQYCITVTNSGPGIATGVNVADTVPANMTFVPGSIAVGGLAVAGTCVLGTPEDDNDTGLDEADPVGGSYDTANNVVRGVLPSVLPLVPVTVAFRATVN